MPQVFISYAHVNPDRELAAELASFLDANGIAVFVDSKIRLGQDWVEQIDLNFAGRSLVSRHSPHKWLVR